MRESQRLRLGTHEVPSSSRARLGVIGLLILLTFVFLVSRLWRLQMLEGENLSVLSENNRLRLKRNVAEGTAFADGALPRDPRRPPYEGIVLAKDVAWSTLAAVEAHQLDIPGVSVEVTTKRHCPADGFAAHLLGYVGEVNPREMSLFPGYRLGDLIGKFGIEKSWETDLRGQGGGQQIEVDAAGRRLRVLGEVEASAGQSLVLTLDQDLQQKAEAALAGKEGAIVVLDVRTGDVLAMVSRPAFDPNLFARGITPEEWRSVTEDPLRPLNNRAIQGQYPPGSTFKVMMAAAALEKGVISPATRFSCSGGLPFGNHVFHCWKKGGHGSLDLQQAITQSCDVYFYQVGQRLGINAIAEYARRFGLGAPLGIALDHEAAGVIPDPAWKKERLGAPWYAGETLSVAIGQGYVTVTPLQMAVAAATIANGGTVYRPHVVKRVLSDEGETLKGYAPEVIRKTGIRPQTLQLVRDGMRDVVNSPTGTGKKAQLSDVLVAGKTGTSQVIAGTRGKGTTLPRQYRDHAWFIAFAPANAPEVAVACLIEHAGQGGGAVAAPVAREVLAAYFALTRGDGKENHEVRQEAHLAF
ncbi:MAG: penicillin-binding protein 2 [Deltaproteobacteria bacterium]|nr:penicillin-binding protein 2 [Deltaproteobacteria bacterium]